MAANLVHPDGRPDPTARFRADLAGSLRHLSGRELADLLDGLPDPVKVDLLAALAARGPAYARLPETYPGHPDAEIMRRRSLREVVSDRRAARTARRTGPQTVWGHPGRLGAQPPVGDPARTRPSSGGLASTPPPRRRAGRAGGAGV
jgi:hypothetical protein